MKELLGVIGWLAIVVYTAADAFVAWLEDL